jgi:phosphoglycolate phosphatase-like HAD superfamily hydrolase
VQLAIVSTTKDIAPTAGREHPMQPTILLFDIDGTLLSAGGAGRRAVVRIFGDRFARPEVFDDVRFHGMTDRAIIRAGLECLHLPADEDAIDALCAAYLAALAIEIPRSEGFRVLPGVAALLEGLAGRAQLAVGLGTGNLREGARIKLEHAGLFHHFAFGGFGCDAEDRAALLSVGAQRGARHLGMAPDACRLVVIGDTPKDVAAARAIGAASLAVATSGFTTAELMAAGATWAFADLAARGVRETLVD